MIGGDFKEKICPGCKTRLSSFVKTGYLGCGVCYQSFWDEIQNMLPLVQNKTENKGKRRDGTLIDKGQITVQIVQMRDYAAGEQRYADAELLNGQISLLSGGE